MGMTIPIRIKNSKLCLRIPMVIYWFNTLASKVDKLFTLNYNKSTYEKVQFSAN